MPVTSWMMWCKCYTPQILLTSFPKAYGYQQCECCDYHLSMTKMVSPVSFFTSQQKPRSGLGEANIGAEFWQSPSHFAAISVPLISQLSHASNTSLLNTIVSEAVPAITELAVAADSPDNHKDLNTIIMRCLRPGGAPSGSLPKSEDQHDGPRLALHGENAHTRLAAVKTLRSLTERLGEEWLALLPEMLPYISELMEDDDEQVERETRLWVKQIEQVLGESLDDMLT
jgi:U3 small nucleolar RNA-associated protein 10